MAQQHKVVISKEEVGNDLATGTPELNECNFPVFPDDDAIRQTKPVFLIREPKAAFDSWLAKGWDDIDLVELNEAFAPQVLAVLKGWGWSEDDSRRDMLNVNGSGISLGHPIGATGGRILADLAHELHRREGRLALETMCIGGGQGLAALFERAA